MKPHPLIDIDRSENLPQRFEFQKPTQTVSVKNTLNGGDIPDRGQKHPMLWPKMLLLWTLILLFPGMPINAQDSSSNNIYGVVEGFWLPDVACELNPGWERIIFDWSQHQPNGPDDWYTLNVDDRWLAAARDCNREVVAIFKHTPDWATDGTPGPGVPKGLYLPIDDPDNYWARFMRKSAEYYLPRGVSRFIIWNEPDITRDTYGFEFEGSLDDYFQMLKVAYLALKQGNPNAEILLAGTTYWHDVNESRRLYTDRLLERIMTDPDAAENDYYFNVLTLHIYFRAETVYDIVHTMRDLLDKYGLQDKRIWITEMNAGPTDDPLWPVVRPQYQIDLAQQSAYLVQTVALGLAAGVERIAVYKFFDWNLPPGDETFGLLRADQSRRPAFDTWAMVIRHLNGVEHAQLAQSEKVDVVRFSHEDGHQTVIAWSKTAESAQIQLSGLDQDVILLDQYGVEQTVTPENGQYRLSLVGARCDDVDKCPVGGQVQLLVLPPGAITVQEVRSRQLIDLTFE
jgi:hypothetical protein